MVAVVAAATAAATAAAERTLTEFAAVGRVRLANQANSPETGELDGGPGGPS